MFRQRLLQDHHDMGVERPPRPDRLNFHLISNEAGKPKGCPNNIAIAHASLNGL